MNDDRPAKCARWPQKVKGLKLQNFRSQVNKSRQGFANRRKGMCKGTDARGARGCKGFLETNEFSVP